MHLCSALNSLLSMVVLEKILMQCKRCIHPNYMLNSAELQMYFLVKPLMNNLKLKNNNMYGTSINYFNIKLISIRIHSVQYSSQCILGI